MIDALAPTLIAPPPPILPARAALFLDFDGTLVEIASRPDAVVVEARVSRLLARLADALDGRVAIVSGRPVAEIAAFFPDHRGAISGSHGAELRRAGEDATPPPTPAWLRAAVERARALAAGHPGMLVEVKPLGLALHYREAPAAERACRALADAIAGDTLHVQPGKMVVEVREAGSDKGGAVRALLDGPDMAGSVPVFVGDDLTDEPAFRAAAEGGGFGVLVGLERPSAAAWRLPDVAATLDWLETAAETRT